MDNNVIGYNLSEMESVRDAINNAAKKSSQKIIERLEDEIITPISKAWYAPEAVEFFKGFAQTVSGAGGKITEAFNSFKDAVAAAANYWAESTGSRKRINLPPIDSVELNLSVDKIQEEDANQDVKIYSDKAQQVANNLENVEQEIKNDLAAISSNLRESEKAFIGNGQSDAITKCFESVNEQVSLVFGFLTGKNGNATTTSLQFQINKAVNKYGDISSTVSSEFKKNTK